ncbi:MAG: hypothetical protein AAB586_01745 [Patescibacteria group bacterium]
MKKYLAELHKKPDYHKKQFALLTSGTITLFIFGVWSLATFGMSNGIVADNDVSNVSTVSEKEVGPLQSFRSNVASSLEAIKNSLEQLQDGFKAINLDAEYGEMKDGALKTYGR